MSVVSLPSRLAGLSFSPRRVVASILLPLLSLSFLLSSQSAAAQHATTTAMLILTPNTISEAGGTSTVTARLDRASSADTTVMVRDGIRYKLGANAELTIPAGQTASVGSVTLTAVDNNVHAYDRTVLVSATATNAQGINNPRDAALTITNDDLEPTVTLVFTPETFTEGEESTYRAHLSHPSEAKQIVMSRQDAVPGVPWANVHISTYGVNVEPGDTVSPPVTLVFRDNDVDEPNRQFRMQFNTYNVINDYKPTVQEMAFTVLDDDGPPTVTLNLSPASISEGGTSTVTAALSHRSGEATTVTISQPATGDYALSANRELTIPAGATASTGVVTITAADDDVAGEDKLAAVSATAANAHGIVAPGDATLTILDNDGPGMSIDDSRVIEGDSGSAAMQFKVNMDRAGAREVTVDWTTADSTSRSRSGTPTAAQAGTDYAARSGRLTFGVGETSKTVTVSATGDNMDEPNETFTVMLSNAVGATLDRAIGTGTITDDDDPPTVTLALTTASITENGGRSAVTATLDRASSAATTVTVSPAAGGDYTLSANRVLTIPAGATASTGLVTITAVDNDADAPDKTVAVSATAANGLGVVVPRTVALTITDDDEPGLSISNARLAEGDSGRATMEFRVTLRGASGEVTVNWATADGTAEAGADYVAGSGRLTFGAGETTKTVSVSVNGDDVYEPNETFTVTLSGVSGATLGRAVATGTITDDDAAPTVTLALTRNTIRENGGTTTVTARLNRASSAATRITVSVTPVSPATASDYALSSNLKLTIPAGATSSTGLVTITALGGTTTTDAAVSEVTVSASATNYQGIAQPGSATLTIIGPARVPFFPPTADAPGTVAVARLVNHSDEAGEVVIEAIDDTGLSAGTVTLPIAANGVAYLTSQDLEEGNAAKGIAEGVGAGQGAWRLELTSDLTITALAYLRTVDRALVAMHDAVPVAGGSYRVATFNPSSNTARASRLRLVNPSDRAAEVTVVGTDDAGVTPDASALILVPAGAATELTADELETMIGDGAGKWRLDVRSTEPILVMNLVTSPAGHLTNLSTVPVANGDAYVVPLLPAASDALGRMGFVRVVNHSADAGEVTITAYDESEVDYEAVTLTIDAGKTKHFNANDLELGNQRKGLSGSTGAGTGDWRLVLTSDLDLDVLAYVRSADGLLVSMHDFAPLLDDQHWISVFNPGSNANQASSLRLVNPGAVEATVTIMGIDDRGASPGTAVTLTVPAGASRTLSATDLENGADGFEGALGDGAVKWRLHVAADQPIMAMSLLATPDGHLTNLSTAPRRGVR